MVIMLTDVLHVAMCVMWYQNSMCNDVNFPKCGDDIVNEMCALVGYDLQLNREKN